MTLVVDASVAMKWLIAEEGSDRAEAVAREDRLIAPDFLLLECGNVFAQRVRTQTMSADDASDALKRLASFPVRRLPTERHVFDAHRLAVQLSRTSYDCLYLAVALAEGAVLVTADQRFARAASVHYPAAVRLL